MYPAVVVAAVDTFKNIDRKNRVIAATVTNSEFSVSALTQVSTIAGISTFGRLMFTTPADSVTLTLRTAGLDTLVTDTFEVLQAISYRTKASR